MKNNTLTSYYIADLVFSVIGFIFVCILFIYVKEMQKLLIILVGTYFALKTVYIISTMKKKRKKIELIKYSQRKLHYKAIKKLSY